MRLLIHQSQILEMAIVKGDLTPTLGAPLVRIDATNDNIFQNEKLASAIDFLARLSMQNRRQPPAASVASHANDNSAEPVSCCARLQHSDNALYIAWEYDADRDESQVLGLLRVGNKQLYLYDRRWLPYEGRFVCVLDFYVHFGMQRRGIGLRLFDYMMESERVAKPHQLAFDNPTVVMLRFLARKYSLEEPIWQNTNYVVFPQLFNAVDSLASEDDVPPEGWRRPATPRRINNNTRATVTGARFLDDAISGHSAARKARRLRDSSVDVNGVGTVISSPATTLGNGSDNAAQLQIEARQRKQHVLSNRPLW